MKSLLIYNASWHTFGGGEKYVCALADVLSTTGTYDVTLLVDKPSITRESLTRYFNLALDNVHVVTVPQREVPDLLATADIGAVVSNFRPFGNRAKKNVYVLQIPYGRITTATIVAKILQGQLKEAGKDLLRRSLLGTARRAYLVLLYSEFVR